VTALALDVAVEIAKPGVFDGIPDAVYHSDPVKGGSLSSTGARKLLPPSCPARFRYDQLNPPPPKHEFDLGHAAHHLVLGTGPELLVIEADDWRTKAAREAKTAAYAAGQVPLLPFEYDQVEDMAAAIRADPIASNVLRPGTGRTELTLVWRDVQSGVMCRARIDYCRDMADGRTLIVDYKTARSAEPEAISKAIAEHGYHQQLDFYVDGALELGLAKDPVPMLIVQEKTAPYLVTVQQVAHSAMEWGSVLNRAAMDIYAECLRTNTWPGYTTSITGAVLPPWKERAYENAQERGEYDIKGKR
jgi:hypothetical protein